MASGGKKLGCEQCDYRWKAIATRTTCVDKRYTSIGASRYLSGEMFKSGDVSSVKMRRFENVKIRRCKLSLRRQSIKDIYRHHY